MEKEFSTLIQKSFPVTARPFAAMAMQLSTEEEELIALYRKLKDEKIIRQTSAIFDTKSLGYDSSLVAFNVNDIDTAAALINTHPGVSHNYERDHDFNLWFTLACAPDSTLGLQKTVELLAERCDANDFLILPTIKMFKISVQLDLKGDRARKQKVEKKQKMPMTLEPIHVELIKGLQKNIEPVAEPFAPLIEALGIDYTMLENETRRLQDAGYMRRFASILHHRRAGFTANAMVVWNIPHSRALAAGEAAATFSAVSHCYLRPTYPNWPYPLFSMVHGQSKKEVETIVEMIAKEIDTYDYRYLYSTREFKKSRIEYFSSEFSAWEARFAG